MFANRSWLSACVLALCLLEACERTAVVEPVVHSIELAGPGELSGPAWRTAGVSKVATGNGWRFVLDGRALQMTTAPEASPVVFSAARVARSGVALSRGQLNQSIASRVTFDGEFTETLETTDEGVLQSWRFERAFGGELTVTIPVSANYLGSTSEGLRFGAPGAAVRYSHATWIDGTGRTTPVPAHFSAGAIVLRVPAEVVARSTFPAVLDPSITPEFVAAIGPPRPAGGARHELPVAAWNGTGWTVVWRSTADDAGVSLLSTALTETGAFAQWSPQVVARGLASSTVPAVAVNRGHAMAVWESAAGVVTATRWSIDGGAVDSVEVGTGTGPGVTRLGASFLVTWLEGSAVSARPVPTIGGLDAGVIVIATTGASGAPSVSSDDTNAIIAWQSSNDIVAARVSPAGLLVDAQPIAISTRPQAERAPRVSCGHTRCVVAWLDQNQRAYAARVDGGVVLDTTPIPVETNGRAVSVAVTWRDTDLLFGWEEPPAWGQGANIVLRRFTHDGQPNAQGAVRLRGLERDQSVSLASHAEFTLATWTVVTAPIHPQDPTAVARVLSESLAGRTFTIPRDTAFSAIPWSARVAASADGYLVVWGQSTPSNVGWKRGDTAELVAARVDRFGRALDPGGILVSDLPYWPFAANTSWNVASNGQDFLIGWTAPGDLIFSSLSSQAVPLDVSHATRAEIEGPPRPPYLPQGSTPALAAKGTGFVAFWGGFDAVASVELDSTGRPLDAGQRISDDNRSSCVQARSANGTVVVSWLGSDAGPVHHFRRVTPTQTIDTEFGGISAQCPFIATNGETSALAWTTTGDGFIRFIDPTGVAGAPLRIGSIAMDVAWDGRRFVVSTPPGISFVSLDGGVETIAGTPSTIPSSGSSIACRTGQCLLVRPEYQPNGGPSRLFATLVADTQPPTASPQLLVTPEDQSVAVSLSGVDPEGAPLVALVNTTPLNGRLSGQPPNLTYTPNRDFFGTDSFSFVVSDDRATSQPATVTIWVSAVNDAPTAQSQSVTTTQGSIVVTLSATDPENDPLSYQVVSQPDAGRLTGTLPTLTYESAASFVGGDEFAFLASDGTTNSNIAVVRVVVTAAPDAGMAGGGSAGGGSAGGGSAGGGSAGGGSSGGGSSGGGSSGGGSSGGGSSGGGSSGGGSAGGGSAGGGSAGGGSAGGGSAGGGSAGGGSAGGGSAGGGSAGGGSAGGGSAGGGSAGGGSSGGGSSGGGTSGGGSAGGNSTGGSTGCGCNSTADLIAFAALLLLRAGKQRRP